MKRKLVLKRLSASDLTLFEHHFRNTAGAKQKAFNLDRVVLVDRLYPSLPATIGLGRVAVSLALYGPGLAQAHVLQRKVLKQQKNWRLDGELIYSPPDQRERYSELKKGDFVLLDFVGEPQPTEIKAYLVARTNNDDARLHNVLLARFEQDLSARLSMVEINSDELGELVAKAGLAESHPIADLLDEDDLEDAANGGYAGTEKLRSRRKARGVSRDELSRAKQAAEVVGRLGEELVNAYFETLKSNGEIEEYTWIAEENAVAPYDFTVKRKGEAIRKLDVKSTGGVFENPIHISMAELVEINSANEPYDIYRIFRLTEGTATLRVARNIRQFANSVLVTTSSLPKGVTMDSVSVAPRTLPFESEIAIRVSLDGDLTE